MPEDDKAETILAALEETGAEPFLRGTLVNRNLASGNLTASRVQVKESLKPAMRWLSPAHRIEFSPQEKLNDGRTRLSFAYKIPEFGVEAAFTGVFASDGKGGYTLDSLSIDRITGVRGR
jgi:hypothetical protein